MSKGLGRGLSSLIPQKINNINDSRDQFVNDFEKSKEGVLELDVSLIKVNTLQPRKRFTDSKLEELASSIKEYGVIQPLLVTEKNGVYELIAGERRLRASRLAGIKKVPVIIKKVDDKQKLELAIIENIQRENLNPIDLGLAYKKLIDDFHLTQEELAKRMGKSRSSVANSLRMLNLPQEIRDALSDGSISEGHAKYLLGLDSSVTQMLLFKKILSNQMSVSETEKEIRKIGGTKASRKVFVENKDQEKIDILRNFFHTKVVINRKSKGGQILIDFFSQEELENIIKKLK